MMQSSFRGRVVGLFVVGLCTVGLAGIGFAQKGPADVNPKAKKDPNKIVTQGDKTFMAKGMPSSLKGRVYARWADNPDGEILFGIQYWNTSDVAEAGDPPGRASDSMNVRVPDDPLCCAHKDMGRPENNKVYAGWYNPQTTVRLRVKDKSLMDRLTKASQELVAMEVQLSGNTVTGFKVLAEED